MPISPKTAEVRIVEGCGASSQYLSGSTGDLAHKLASRNLHGTLSE